MTDIFNELLDQAKMAHDIERIAHKRTTEAAVPLYSLLELAEHNYDMLTKQVKAFKTLHMATVAEGGLRDDGDKMPDAARAHITDMVKGLYRLSAERLDELAASITAAAKIARNRSEA